MKRFRSFRTGLVGVLAVGGLGTAAGASAALIKLNLPLGSLRRVSGLAQYLTEFHKYFIGGIGLVAVTMIMFGGFRWMTAAGSSDKIKSAKDNIISAILGVFLALISYVLLNLINPSLVVLRDPNLILSDVQTSGVAYFCKDVEGMDDTSCGKQLAVPGTNKFCYGSLCGSPKYEVCVKGRGTNGAPACVLSKDACQGMKDENRCGEIDDLFVENNIQGVACRKLDQSFILGGPRDDDCHYGSLLHCPTGYDRVDCTAPSPNGNRYSPCAYLSVVASCSIRDPEDDFAKGMVTCHNATESRAAELTDAICCQSSSVYLSTAKTTISCATSPWDYDPSNTYFRVDCNLYNDKPGSFKTGEATCSGYCFGERQLTIWNDGNTFCDNPQYN